MVTAKEILERWSNYGLKRREKVEIEKCGGKLLRGKLWRIVGIWLIGGSKNEENWVLCDLSLILVY